MPLRHAHFFSALVATTCVLPGCERENAEPAGVYESCSPYDDGEPCEDEAVCRANEPDGMSARCTYACTSDEQCPPSPSGQAVCMRFLTGAHCAVACQSDDDCVERGVCERQTELDGKGVALCR